MCGAVAAGGESSNAHQLVLCDGTWCAQERGEAKVRQEREPLPKQPPEVRCQLSV